MGVKFQNVPWTRVDTRGVPYRKSAHDRAYPDQFGRWRYMGDALRCTELGWRICYLPPGTRMALYHRHPEQEEVFYVRRGECTADIEGDAVALPEGTLLRIPPGVGQEVRNTGTTLAEIVTAGAPRDAGDANYPRNPDQRQGSGAAPLPEPLYVCLSGSDLEWRADSSTATADDFESYRNADTVLGCTHLRVHLARLAPGTCAAPFHRHATEEDVFLVLAGQPVLDVQDRSLRLLPDEAIRIPPKVSHRLGNPAGEEALVLCFSAPRDLRDYSIVTSPPGGE